MADSKITDLSELTTPATDDVLAVVDISEVAAADKNKKIQVSNVMKGVANGSATSPSIAFQSDPNTGLYRSAADKLAIATNGIHRATVDDSGQVLIATETENGNSKLQVNGTIYANPYTIGDVSSNIIFGIGDSAAPATVYDNLVSGTKNICIGFDGSKSITTGSNNILIGDFTVIDDSSATTSAQDKVCIGRGAGVSNYSYSVCIGREAGQVHGGAITAIGYQAGYSHNNGTNNTAVGYQAFATGAACVRNTAVGYQALYGAGLFTEKNDNVAVGYQSLHDNRYGSRHVAIGGYALDALQSGDDNVAVGWAALSDCTSSDNVAIGSSALADLSSGTKNVAVGYRALGSGLTTHSDVIGVGASVGYLCTATKSFLAGTETAYEGDFTNCVNIGYKVHRICVSASDQVAIGYQAMSGRLGTNTNCTAVGSQAIGSGFTFGNTTGNTGIGASALTNCTGNYNTALGELAGSDITTGSGNIVIGDRNAAGTSAPVHTITTADNRVVMGSTAVTNAYIQVGWTTVSDERDKTNFAEVPHGLDFITQLNPVAFQFRESRESDVAVGPVRYGFKAQEVMALEGSNPVIIDNEDQNRLKYTAEGLVPVLVNAIKEQQSQIAALQARIDEISA